MKFIILSLLAALFSAQAQADVVDPGSGAFTIKCSSPKSKKGYTVEVSSDLSKAKVNNVSATSTNFLADLVCTKVDPAENAQTPKGGKSPVARCRQPNIADAGFGATLYAGKVAGTYTLELNNQTFAGPKRIDTLTCK